MTSSEKIEPSTIGTPRYYGIHFGKRNFLKSQALGRDMAFGEGVASPVKHVLGRIAPMKNFSDPVNSGSKKKKTV